MLGQIASDLHLTFVRVSANEFYSCTVCFRSNFLDFSGMRYLWTRAGNWIFIFEDFSTRLNFLSKKAWNGGFNYLYNWGGLLCLGSIHLSHPHSLIQLNVKTFAAEILIERLSAAVSRPQFFQKFSKFLKICCRVGN